MLLNAAKCQGVEQKVGKVKVDQTDPFSWRTTINSRK